MLLMAMLSTAGALHKFCQCLHNEEEGEESSARDPVTPFDAMPRMYTTELHMRKHPCASNRLRLCGKWDMRLGTITVLIRTGFTQPCIDTTSQNF